MKTIKAGNPALALPWWCRPGNRHTCTTCTTVVELEPTDPGQELDDQRDGASKQWTCPICDKPNWTSERETDWVRSNLNAEVETVARTYYYGEDGPG